MHTDDVSAWAITASQLGPDFYAVLLTTVVTTGAGALLLRAQRSNPKLSEAELRPYRLSFYLSCGCGVIAVLVSIGWYIYRQTHGNYTAQIAITNVMPNVKIDSRYFSKVSFHKNESDGAFVADLYYLIVKDRPFCEKDNFTFDIFVSSPGVPDGVGGGIGINKPVSVQFSGKPSQSYSLELDSSLQPQLKAIASNEKKQWFHPLEIQNSQLAMRDLK